MYTLTGVAIGSGVALAPAKIITQNKSTIDEDELFVYDKAKEKERYQKKSLQFTNKLRQIISPARDSVRDLVGAAAGFIVSADNTKEILALIDKGCSASMAARSVLLANLEIFFTNNQDLKEDKNELTGLIIEFIEALAHRQHDKLELPNLNSNVILCADELTPAMFLSLNTNFIKGVILERGRDSGNLGIVLRELEIPALYGVFGATTIKEDTEILIDGNNGVVVVEPKSDYAEEILSRQEFCQDLHNDESLLNITIAPAIGTIDQNNSNISQISHGLGLLRSEFLFLGNEEEPSEEEMYLKFKEIFSKVNKGAPITARTFDFADDKKPLFNIKNDEDGPLKGYGACVNSKLLKKQIRAFLRAAPESITIVFPLITKISEKEHLVNLAYECEKELDSKNIKHAALKLSFMIETPAAVLLAQSFAKDCSLMIIGTSSLAEYASAPCPPEKAFTPVLAKMIVMTAKAAAVEGIPLGIAGRFTSRAELLPFYYRLGVKYLVAGPYNLNKLRSSVERFNLEQDIVPKFDERLYQKIMACYTGSELSNIILETY